MNDLEITKKCAEKMGLTFRSDMSNGDNWIMTKEDGFYSPLGDDAQMAALVKKFPIECAQAVQDWADDWVTDSTANLNRYVCTCVAKL